MGLGAVIQTLSLNRYMGTLRIETEDAGNQFLFLSEGEIVLVRQVQRDPVRLGDLLLRAGKLQEEQLQAALAEQKQRTTGRLGALLVELGMIQQDEIERVIRAKFEEEVLDMFLLDRGRFEFIFGLSPEALFAPDEKLERVALNAEGLMLEAMRRIDEWQEMFKALGNLDTIYQNRGTRSEDVAEISLEGIDLPGPTRLALYQLLDGTRSLREVLAEAIRSRIASRRETFLFLYGLYKGELVTPLDTKTLLTEARNALGAKDVPKAAKYIRAILGRKGELELSLTRRYLDFLRKNKRPKLAFEEARLFAAQCLARGDIEQAIALYEEAISLEFRNAEVLDRLFYTLLRANRRDRAVQVGLALRDHLGSEAGVTVATRVVRNLKELAPDDPEVHELAGLVHKQREENEDAVRELERALAGIGQKHVRRGMIVGALLELQPGRADLLAEKESAEVQAAREQLRREFRRRLLLVGVLPTALLLLAIGVWAGLREAQAREALVTARGLCAGDPGENLSNYRQAADLLGNVADSWTVGAEARALKQELDGKIAAALKAERAQREELIKRTREVEDARQRELQRQEQAAALEQGLLAYTKLVGGEEYAAATHKALELRQAFPDAAAQLDDLKLFLRAESEPGGAEAYLDGKLLGTTPLVIGLPAGKKAKLSLRLRGYQVLEEELAGAEFQTRRFTLEPGPVWRQELASPPLVPMGAGRQGLVLAEAGGRLTPLSFVDGRPLWSPPSRDALEAIETAGHARPAGLDWAVSAGSWAIVGAGPVVASWELSTGQPQRVHKLPGRTRFFPPPVVRLKGQELLVLVDQKSCTVFAPASGQLVLEVPLPAPAAQPPVVGGGRVFIPLQGDELLAVDLQERSSAPILWRQSGLPSLAAPLYSERSEAVVLRSAQELRSVRAVDGQVLATLRPDLGPLQDAAVIDERVYVLSKSGLLAGLGVYDGELVVRGTKVAEQPVSHGPLTVGKDLVLVDAAGEVLRVSPSGRRRGGKLTLGGTPSAVQSVEDRVLAVLGEKTVVLLEPTEE